MSSFSISAQYVYFLVALQRTAGDCPQHRSLSHFTSSLYVKFKNTVRLRNAEKFSKREGVVSQSVLAPGKSFEEVISNSGILEKLCSCFDSTKTQDRVEAQGYLICVKCCFNDWLNCTYSKCDLEFSLLSVTICHTICINQCSYPSFASLQWIAIAFRMSMSSVSFIVFRMFFYAFFKAPVQYCFAPLFNHPD